MSAAGLRQHPVRRVGGLDGHRPACVGKGSSISRSLRAGCYVRATFQVSHRKGKCHFKVIVFRILSARRKGKCRCLWVRPSCGYPLASGATLRSSIEHQVKFWTNYGNACYGNPQQIMTQPPHTGVCEEASFRHNLALETAPQSLMGSSQSLSSTCPLLLRSVFLQPLAATRTTVSSSFVSHFIQHHKT